MLAGALAAAMPAPAGRAATSELTVADRLSGVALGGFDPVAYFSEGAALEGRPEHEYMLDGMAWRFRNAGNRAAFARDPAVYRPGFGGYDPVVLAEQRPVPGDPRIWAIHESRVYLFATEGSRRRFLDDPQRLLQTAGEAWPAVVRTLVP